MHQVSPIAYYAEQSPLTNPGRYAEFLDDLPSNVVGICRAVQGLIAPFDGDHSVPKDRITEMNTRYVSRMLTRIIELDNHPLTEARPLEKRLIGCRDFAVLFCAMTRHQGIPTRTRCGFAPYVRTDSPGFIFDHVIDEYWDIDDKRWRLVDPEQSDELININKISFDVTDIPRDKFVVGGRAWQMCRAGKADPDQFGDSPDSPFKGWRFVRNRMIHDLAMLNRRELLLWDTWGLMDMPIKPTEEDLLLLDGVAELTQAGNEGFCKMRLFYETEAKLKVPTVVTSYSPCDEPRSVELTI